MVEIVTTTSQEVFQFYLKANAGILHWLIFIHFYICTANWEISSNFNLQIFLQFFFHRVPNKPRQITFNLTDTDRLKSVLLETPTMYIQLKYHIT